MSVLCPRLEKFSAVISSESRVLTVTLWNTQLLFFQICFLPSSLFSPSGTPIRQMSSAWCCSTCPLSDLHFQRFFSSFFCSLCINVTALSSRSLILSSDSSSRVCCWTLLVYFSVHLVYSSALWLLLMTITLNCLSGKLLISVSLRFFPLRFFFFFLTWNIFPSFLILLDSLCFFFLHVRWASFLS